MCSTDSKTQSAVRRPASRSIPPLAARLGFTAEELSTDTSAIIEGMPATVPLITNGHAYNIRVRLPPRTALRSMQSRTPSLPAPRAISLRCVLWPRAAASWRSRRFAAKIFNVKSWLPVVWRALTSAHQSNGSKPKSKRLHLPKTVRVSYGGTYEEQQKSFSELTQVLLFALVLVFAVLLAEFRNLYAPFAILVSSVLSIGWSDRRSADHRNHLQRRVIHGTHYGDRHRCEERHPFTGRGGTLSRQWHVSRGGNVERRTAADCVRS